MPGHEWLESSIREPSCKGRVGSWLRPVVPNPKQGDIIHS
jgi:hypothetical protein